MSILQAIIDEIHGHVASVDQVYDQATTTAAAAVGDTTLIVDDVNDLDSVNGGWITVQSEDGSYGPPIAYAGADDEADTIALASPLGTAVDSGVALRVTDSTGTATLEWQATVLDDSIPDGEAIQVPLTHALIDKLDTGIRGLIGESVVVTRDSDGAWTLTDILGKSGGEKPHIELSAATAGQSITDTTPTVMSWAVSPPVAPLSAYATAVLADAPAIYWRLNELTGTTAIDESGAGKHGTYNGSPALGAESLLNSDPSNKAVTFDGVDDYVTVNDPTVPTDYTVEALFKVPANPTSSARVIAAKYDAGLDYHTRTFSLNYTPLGQIQAEFYDGTGSATTLTSSAIAVGKTVYVAATFKAGGGTGNCKVYMYDATTGASLGTLSGTRTGGPSASYPSPRFSAGAKANGTQYFLGTIDEVAYYTKTLDATRVAAHVAAAAGAPPAAPSPAVPNIIVTAGAMSATDTAVTVPRTGRYQITGSIAFAASAAGRRLATLRVNGVEKLNFAGAAAPTGITALPIAACFYLNAGDQLDATVSQTSGAALAINDGYLTVTCLD